MCPPHMPLMDAPRNDLGTLSGGFRRTAIKMGFWVEEWDSVSAHRIGVVAPRFGQLNQVVAGTIDLRSCPYSYS